MVFGFWDKIKGERQKWTSDDPKDVPNKTESGLLKQLGGMLPKVKQLMKNPAVLARLKGLQAQMEKDGVDVNNEAAVKAWVEANKAKLEKDFEVFKAQNLL